MAPGSIVDVGGHDEEGPLVAIVDYGLKSNIVRAMRRRGARVRILPHTISTAVALAPDIDGRTIDDIVDYLTFTFIPMLLVWRMGWVPFAPGLVGRLQHEDVPARVGVFDLPPQPA